MKEDAPATDEKFMRHALRFAKRALGRTSPNPIVGAVIARDGKLIGQGYHHRAGQPHAEIEAFRETMDRGCSLKGATLYVTLEPCSTIGRTPPCTDAIIRAGISRVVLGAIDPNPAHAGEGLRILKRAGIKVVQGVLEKDASDLNPGFNHWIVHGRPLVTLKSAMTLDGKIATRSGESKWITSERARAHAMNVRFRHDAILVGINTVMTDNPTLTARSSNRVTKVLRRLVLDPKGRIDFGCKLLTDEFKAQTIVVSKDTVSRRFEKQIAATGASLFRCKTLENGELDLDCLLENLGAQSMTALLVEGGSETHFSFLRQRAAHRILCYYAPKIFGGRDARKSVSGTGFNNDTAMGIIDPQWRKLEEDLVFTGKIRYHDQ